MKRNITTHTLLALTTAAILTGCATGSAILTGTARPSIPVESVKIYSTPPADYEVIGIVKASSDAGWTEQGSTDYAIKDLKRRAAKLGANGVLLFSTGSKTSAVVGGFGSGLLWGIPISAQTVEGQAILVQRED
jgi:hypothetical protein